MSSDSGGCGMHLQNGAGDHLGTGVAESDEQGPVNREPERLINGTANRVPHAASPEQRLLRHVVSPGQDLIVVRREHPPTNLAVVFVDYHAVPVDDVRSEEHTSELQ